MIFLALGALAMFAAGAFAGDNHYYYNYRGFGPGPNCYTYAPCPAMQCPACPIYGTGPCELSPYSCGAFCEAGQLPVGWQYNWCDEYWL